KQTGLGRFFAALRRSIMPKAKPIRVAKYRQARWHSTMDRRVCPVSTSPGKVRYLSLSDSCYELPRRTEISLIPVVSESHIPNVPSAPESSFRRDAREGITARKTLKCLQQRIRRPSRLAQRKGSTAPRRRQIACRWPESAGAP